MTTEPPRPVVRRPAPPSGVAPSWPRPRAVRRRRPAGPAARLGRLRGRARRRAAGRAALARRAAPAALAPRRARRRPGLRHRRARRPRRPRTPRSRHAFAVGRERGLSGRPSRRRRSPQAVRTRAGPRRPRAAAAAARVAGAGARPAAQPAARPARDQPPLRPLQRVLRADPRPADGLLLRLLRDDPDQSARGRPSAPSSTWSAASSASGPAATLLDVGCGWGSLSLHAAEHFGAQVVGVTIAAEQKKFIDARIAERGLGDRVEIRLQDYREVPERGALRRGRLARDGRARRRAQLPDVRRGAARARSGPAAGCWCSRCRAPARASRRRAVHRVVHRARHAHAAGRRDRRAARGGRPRGARRARAARALRAHRRRLAGELRAQPRPS